MNNQNNNKLETTKAPGEWLKNPSDWGYYWVMRGRGYPEMVCVQPGPTYEQDGRSVEVWDCPGERRSRLDARRMPKNWQWQKITPPDNLYLRMVQDLEQERDEARTLAEEWRNSCVLNGNYPETENRLPWERT